MTDTDFYVPDYGNLGDFVFGETWSSVVYSASRLADNIASWMPERHRDDDMRLLQEADDVLGTGLKELGSAHVRITVLVNQVKKGDPILDADGSLEKHLTEQIEQFAETGTAVRSAFHRVTAEDLNGRDQWETFDRLGRLCIRLDTFVGMLETIRERLRIRDALRAETSTIPPEGFESLLDEPDKKP